MKWKTCQSSNYDYAYIRTSHISNIKLDENTLKRIFHKNVNFVFQICKPAKFLKIGAVHQIHKNV